MEQNATEIKSATRGLQSTDSNPPQQKSYPFPTEVISLPSKGLLYPKGSPLSKGEVTIKLLTAKEEDILTSPNLIKKGLVMEKLLESVLVEHGVNVNDLVLGDKNAILISTRLLAYGPEYKIKVTDKEYDEEVDWTVDLSKIQIKEVDYSLLNSDNEFPFTLPSGIPIKFKILTHGDEVAINRDIEAAEKATKQSSEITARYRRVITEVEGNRDFGYISNFVSNRLLARDSRDLRKYIASVTPDLDFKFDYTSPFTGDTEALSIPFGTDFFYPTE
jgi:hypothetical protein